MVRKEHCEGMDYLDPTGCPLCAAIREQLPDFKLYSVSGDFVRDKNNNPYYFDSHPTNGWTSSRVRQLESGGIDSFKVTFTCSNYKGPIEEPKPKTEYRVREVEIEREILQDFHREILAGEKLS